MTHYYNSESNTTLQHMIDGSVPGDRIEVGRCVIREKLEIRTNKITLVGEPDGSTVITYDDFARKKHEDGNDYGTFRSYTCLVLADDVTLENITIINGAGDGRTVGQAITLYAEGDRLKFSSCRFVGYQDTLFTGPLPESPRIPGSFKGPSEGREYRSLRQYYENCHITGDVDFIFGSSLCVFNRCTMVTRNRNEEINGFVTAPSTRQDEPYGYVFIDCDFIGEPGISNGTVFLGRPWRPYGQVMLIACRVDQSIHPDQWDMWGNESNRDTAKFGVYEEMPELRLDEWHREMYDQQMKGTVDAEALQ